MTKVYGKTSGRAMRALARGLLALTIAIPVVSAPILAKTVRADELMLMQEPVGSGHGYGWLFIGLTLVSYGVAANDYEESQYYIKKAKDAYKSYKSITDPTKQALVLAYRDQTTKYSNRAQAYESTANAALILGSLFALTAIAIFRSDGVDNTPILITDRSISFQMKF